MYVKKTINIRQNTFTYRYIDLLVSVKFHHSNYCYTSWNWSHFIYNSNISWKTIFNIINKGKFNILSHWHASKLRIKPGYITFIKEKITLQMFNILPFFFILLNMLKKMNKCISMQIKRFFKEKLIQHSDAAFAKITKTHQLRQWIKTGHPQYKR